MKDLFPIICVIFIGLVACDSRPMQSQGVILRDDRCRLSVYESYIREVLRSQSEVKEASFMITENETFVCRLKDRLIDLNGVRIDMASAEKRDGDIPNGVVALSVERKTNIGDDKISFRMLVWSSPSAISVSRYLVKMQFVEGTWKMVEFNYMGGS